jgi:hypothetical protein
MCHRIVIPSVALCFTVTVVPIAAAQGTYFYCHSSETYGGKVYVSQLLKSEDSARVLNDAFANYLAKEHGYEDHRRGYRQLACITGMPENQKSAAARQGYITNLPALGYTIVETGWTGPPGTTVPDPPPAAPVDLRQSPK